MMIPGRTKVVLWGTAPWIALLPQPVTPALRTPQICDNLRVSNRIHSFAPIECPHIVHITRTSLDRIRKFLKIKTVHRYTCKRTGEQKIVQDLVI